jgi:hypothetical protein
LAHGVLGAFREASVSEPQEGDQIDVWFSCGAASAVALKLTIQKYGNLCRVRAINNLVQEEDSDNRRFLADVAKWVGIDIEDARNVKYPEASAADVWRRRGFMAGRFGAPCTQHLKKEARQQWENANRGDWLVFGFTAEERRRSEMFALTERANVLPVLIDAGLTKEDCFAIIREAGIDLPRVYAMGYPNANCIGCVKATSPTYWNHVRAMHPVVFEERAAQSRELGARLVRYKGQRLFLDELPADATGKPLKSMKPIECGLFCEEA